jgi:hypothetical protein
MTRMLCKQSYIPQRQQVQLKRLAKARSISEAKIIRQAIKRRFCSPLRGPWLAAIQR